MRCPATITTFTTMRSSGRMSAPMPSGGWRRSRLRGRGVARPKAAPRRDRADLWLWAAALAVAAWAIFYPRPYGLCILVLAGGALAFLALRFARPRRFPVLKKNGMLGTAT